MAHDNAQKQPRPRGNHGGARRGAGRPSALTDEERLWIGADCEGAFVAATRERNQTEIDDLLERQSEYREVIREAMKNRAANVRGEEFEWHRDSVAMELLQIAENLPKHFQMEGRWLRLKPIKPQGVRNEIIAKVAADWSARLGVKVRESAVEKCWDWVRALRKSLAEDSDN